MTSSKLSEVLENGPWTLEDLHSLSEAMKAMGFMQHTGIEIEKQWPPSRAKRAALDLVPSPPPPPPVARDLLPSRDAVAAPANDPPIARSTPPNLTGQQMSVPEPVTVHCNGNMPEKDFKKCSRIMSLCKNVIQKTLVDAAEAHGIQPTEALKDMGGWIKAYMDFPFPFFNYVDFQQNKIVNRKFSLKADADVVHSILNIKNVPDLKDAVIKALKKSDNSLATYEGKDQKFNYFGIITTYNEDEISLRVVSFSMNMKETSVRALCGGMESCVLDCEYVTYQFEADKYMMMKMQDKVGDKELDFIAEKFLDTINAFLTEEIARWKENVMAVIAQLKPKSG
ncbi:hypothetical protein Vafri_12368 [Volvox africanus]|uniref:Uncharacterized protein n=1 Tax=Volvox africanus TaxID=51714 RepID=A0A8J4B9Z6_9CHLO|nr:hypothetical protein Vafri_12368 [Volvox africanus]